MIRLRDVHEISDVHGIVYEVAERRTWGQWLTYMKLEGDVHEVSE